MSEPAPIRFTGGFAWTGRDPLESARAVFGLLGDDIEAGGAPFLPVLNDRGPHAELQARTLALLEGIEVDLAPYGWRIGRGHGIDALSAHGVLGEDVEVFSLAGLGWAGPVVLPALGPTSLCAATFLPAGELAIGDRGARRDVASALLAGLLDHAAHVQRLVPGCTPVIVLDEPMLPAALSGSCPTASGYRRHPAISTDEVRGVLTQFVAALHRADLPVVVRLDGVASPETSRGYGSSGGRAASGGREASRDAGDSGTMIADLLGLGVDALAFPPSQIEGAAEWEALGGALDAKQIHWWAMTATEPTTDAVMASTRRIVDPLRRLGLSDETLARVVALPRGGSGRVTTRAGLVAAGATARELAEATAN